MVWRNRGSDPEWPGDKRVRPSEERHKLVSNSPGLFPDAVDRSYVSEVVYIQ